MWSSLATRSRKSGYAPVEMTKGRVALPGSVVAEQTSLFVSGTMSCPVGAKTSLVQQSPSPEALPFPLSSRPKRTRISYSAPLATTTCAALLKESRMQIINATGLHGKSGGA
jgi:hypothetical protein